VLGSTAHLLVRKPVAIFGNWKILLAHVANRLGRWSNAVADDFVDRLAGRAEIEKVVHGTSECWRTLNANMGGTLPYIRARVPPFASPVVPPRNVKARVSFAYD
jgi:hypothetical protein